MEKVFGTSIELEFVAMVESDSIEVTIRAMDCMA